MYKNNNKFAQSLCEPNNLDNNIESDFEIINVKQIDHDELNRFIFKDIEHISKQRVKIKREVNRTKVKTNEALSQSEMNFDKYTD